MKSAQKPEILLDRHMIADRIGALGIAIGNDFGNKDLCVAPVMDGGMIFAADLIRQISLPLTVTPIKASSYGNATISSGKVDLPWPIPDCILEKDILLIDDILDTGRTLTELKVLLLAKGARSVSTCVLLRKESSAHHQADYIGFEITDTFVVGYGLDLAGLYRNLPDLCHFPSQA